MSTTSLTARDMVTKHGQDKASSLAYQFLVDSPMRDKEGRWFWFAVLSAILGSAPPELARTVRPSSYYHLTRPLYLASLAALGRAWAEHQALRYARWLELVEMME